MQVLRQHIRTLAGPSAPRPRPPRHLAQTLLLASTHTTTTSTQRSRAMSSTTANNLENNGNAATNITATGRQQQPQQEQNPLPLPEPPTGGATALPVDGEGVKLDHLGPLVVNVDGTMSRISNWDNMADIERENTLRIIGKRNKARLAALRGTAAAPPSSPQQEANTNGKQ